MLISGYDSPYWYAYVWDQASRGWVSLDHDGAGIWIQLPFAYAPLSRSNFELYQAPGWPNWTVPDTWYGWYYPLRLWDPQAPWDPYWWRWVPWSSSIPTHETNGNQIEGYYALWWIKYQTFHAFGPVEPPDPP